MDIFYEKQVNNYSASREKKSDMRDWDLKIRYLRVEILGNQLGISRWKTLITDKSCFDCEKEKVSPKKELKMFDPV